MHPLVVVGLLYYNNICYVIINGVNQLEELLVFQMFGHVDLKSFGAHVVYYISIRYILWICCLTLNDKGCCPQGIVTEKSAGTQEI